MAEKEEINSKNIEQYAELKAAVQNCHYAKLVELLEKEIDIDAA